ncbi:LCP family protein [Longispora sp. K20-0274]|uniref:LCP family protein n=1 Tax=Longispora sp. K20-0274 TaxID=3088255 RepID=UPI00399BF3F9
MSDAIGSDSLLPAGSGNQPRSEVKGPLNILLAGLDYRAGDPDSEANQRADSVMWVHIPREHDMAYIVSLPRDLVVDIPAFPAAKFPGEKGGRLNASFGAGMQNKLGRPGGMQLLTKTVEQLTGVKFDMAGVIDWYGFTGITHELGGVTMCLDKGFTSSQPGFKNYSFPTGCNHYDEHTALALVRQRYDVEGGDYGRQKLQQQFIMQILKQAMGKDVLTNPLKLNGIIKSVGNSLKIDFGAYDFADLLWALKGITPTSLVTMRVPSSQIGNQNDYGGEALNPTLGPEMFRAMADERINVFLAAHTELANKLPA